MIGEVARDARALGYDYGAPAVPDSSGAPPVVAAAPPQSHLYVILLGIRCVRNTYLVDVFVGMDAPTPAGHAGPHYVGRMTRLGMGVEDDEGRCIRAGVTRALDASHNAQALGLTAGSDVAVGLLAQDAAGRLVAPAEYGALSGFAPIAVWGAAMPLAAERSRPCHC
jgi:tyrosinase